MPRTIYSIICCLFVFSAMLRGQTLSFRSYDVERGIPNSFIYTLGQSNDGYLWIGMGNGLAMFDGFEFFRVAYPDSASGRYATTSFRDNSGRLWFGCSDGKVYYAEGRSLIDVQLSNSKSISDIISGPDEMIYVIPQGGSIFAINTADPSKTVQYSLSIDPVMFSGCFTHGEELLIGTQENLLLCRLKADSVRIINVVEGFDYSAITAIHPTENPSVFLIGTDGYGLFKFTVSGSENSLERFSGHPEWETLSVQEIVEDRDKNIWVATFGSGVIEFKLTSDIKSVRNVLTYDISTGLSNNDVKTFFQDIEGNYWFGTYGNGILLLTSYAFGFFTPGRTSLENNIIYVNKLGDRYLLGTPSGFHIFNAEKGVSESFTNLLRSTEDIDITSYFLDKEKNLWIGTAGGGLYVRRNTGVTKLFYRSGDSGADNIRDVKTDEYNVWLATINGVFVINRSTGSIRKKFDINNGLPHSSINSIFLDSEGRAVIGINEGERVFMIDRNFDIITSEGTMSGSTLNRMQAINQGKDGSIWISTRGNGVFKLQNDTVSPIVRSNELFSNYCYSILPDYENNIWIGHEKGFSRYNPVTGSIKTFGVDFAKGGLCNPGGMFESSDRKVLIGTTEGLIIYDRMRDNRSTIPPFTNLNYLTINDKRYDYQPVYTLPYKKYNIRLNFVGINFSDPEKVYYSTFVENFDETWSRFSDTRDIPYSLGDGKYKFNIISVNQDGASQKDPLSFTILIKKPWWRTWWSILCWITLFTGVLVLIIKIRERSHKRIQEYLETELDARTSEVMKQKGEIELQNLEITDSINYAKRIQTSILPDYGKLRDAFKDAFVIFQPRDIVSGDFYWFDRLDEDKFILVCADSTGHGVPGAFMSMIGSTLLQDIVSRQHVSTPSQILTLLDKQIFSTLNQNVELGVSNDGMDMVVCEFSIKKRHVRFASAMRPVIIVIDGESFYIKGNRSSVGGESVMEKYFDDQEYYLNEGDTIYLFSDGLPDQFGGIDGKKMKIARLKRLIEQVSNKTMVEQQEYISKFFSDWKGDYEQVDDVLLIGVRV
ncbi:MAG TPA: two-component regulator propeller domain-containing protein [Bacteroidales bacterium]|nr:two-component regulator propeller domain-containing protein [Bacteroidales bacterium]